MVAGHGGEARRTAIVVVGGVGDLPSGANAERVALGLLSHNPQRFAYATSQTEEYAARKKWFGVRPPGDAKPDAKPQQVTRHTLHDNDHRPVVDVYEAWWADLSRFPGATRSALLATVGMLFQLTSVGRAALRGGPRIAGIARTDEWEKTPRQHPQFRVSGQLIDLLEWVVAVPIVLITVVHLALLAMAWYALKVHADNPLRLAGFSALALLLVGVMLWFVLCWYPKKRSTVQVAGLLLVSCATVVAIWRGVDGGRHADVGIADSIFALTAYPFRAAWMLVALLALAVVVTTTTRVLVCPRNSPVYAWRRIGTAALSAMGPFGLAIVGALVYGAAANALQKLAQSSKFSADPWCLQQVNNWTTGPCAAPGTTQPGALDAFEWGKHLFQLALTPLLYVSACALVAVVLALLVAVKYRSVAGGYFARVIRVAPWTLGIGAVPATVLVVLSWLPLGDHALVWHSSLEPWNGSNTAVGAVVLGYLVTGLLAGARLLKLSPVGGLNKGVIPEGVRVPLDLAYDISSFLREPSKQDSVAPRERMLARIAALLEHVHLARPYDGTILFTHSQGAALATALLHRDPTNPLTIPGGHVTLLTMGAPLTNLYYERFPVQFDWVGQLYQAPRAFVDDVDRRWINFYAAGDLVGQRLFDPTEDPPPPPDPFPHDDVAAGNGGHGSYYSSPIVFQALAALVPA